MVKILKFSPDERFLCSTGADSVLHIWDLQTGEVIIAKRFSSPVSLFQWCDMSTRGRRVAYDVAIAAANDVSLCCLRFDATRQQWNLEFEPVSMPTAGMVREYLCSTRSNDGDELLAGSNVGDMIIFKLSSRVYRASVPVCSGGVRAIVVGRDNRVFCGGGDGTVSRLNGADMRWTLEASCHVTGAVTSLSMISSGTEIVAGTDAGRVYRIATKDMATSLIAQSHTDGVTCVAFGLRSDLFASASRSGDVKVWDLSDYSVIAETQVVPRGADRRVGQRKGYDEEDEIKRCFAACIAWVGDSALITGWSDQFIRCHDASTMQVCAPRRWD
jgi:WD40 repeat protein